MTELLRSDQGCFVRDIISKRKIELNECHKDRLASRHSAYRSEAQAVCPQNMNSLND